MAHYLEPIVQELLLQASEFMSGLADVRRSLLETAGAAGHLGDALASLDKSAAITAAALSRDVSAIKDLRTQVTVAGSAVDSLARAFIKADGAANRFADNQDNVRDAMGIVTGTAVNLSARLNDLRDTMLETAAAGGRPLISTMKDLRTAAAAAGLTVSALSSKVSDLRARAGTAATAMSRLVSSTRDLRTTLAGAGAMADRLGDKFMNVALKSMILQDALVFLDAELDKKKAAIGVTGLEAAALAAALLKLSSATNTASSSARTAYGFWRLSGTAIHWLISGFAELAAVVVPATVAAGAWAAVWLQGTVNVYQHMMAVYTATEATANIFGVTAGEAVGLGHALQTAQNAANPDVYQALGGAINIVNEHFGNLAQTGLQVGRVFDGFVARLVSDFAPGGALGSDMNSLLSHMVSDLTGIGQVFGNLGHLLASFAAQMPGLAEVLLGLLDVLTKVGVEAVDLIGHFQFMGASLLTVGMAVEEFSRWGGLLVTILGKLGLGTVALSGSFFSLERFGGIFTNIFGVLPKLLSAAAIGFGGLLRAIGPAGGAINRLGTNIGGLGSDLEEAAAAVTPLQAALGVLAVAAIGFLIYKLATAKTAAQQFGDSMVSMVGRASNLNRLQVAADATAQLQQHMQAATAQMHQFAAGASQAGTYVGRSGLAINGAAADYHGAVADMEATTQAQRQVAQSAANTISGATELAAKYGTSIPAAMALASAAGVNLSQGLGNLTGKMSISAIKIADLVQGYKAMGQPMGVVGKDMTAVAIQAGLQGTKVSQLNQAWDSFMQTITAGTSGLASFEQSLSGLTSGTNNVTDILGKTNSVTLSVKNFASSLKSFTGQGAQAWQNFDQVIGSTAPQMIDWLRTAGAEGAISGPQFTQAVKDMTAQLLPFAKDSKTAASEVSDLAQQAGGPATDSYKTLAKWADNGRTSTKGFAQIVQDATVKMGNMSQVAQQLGTVMQQDIINAMDSARLAASGATGALQKYYGELMNGTSQTQAGEGTRHALIADLEKTGLTAKQSAAYVRLMQSQINGLHGKSVNIDTYYHTYGTPGGGTGTWGVGGSGHATGPANAVIIHNHIAGSVLSEQGLARATQQSLNRKTLRNGSTQMFIPTRLH